MKLYTIGFTQNSAERFFSLLRDNGVERVVDIRLNPGGQLSGFAKGSDLAWFLDRLSGCAYVHLPQLAPTAEILGDYRRDYGWDRYTRRFAALMDERGIPDTLDRAAFETSASCLLCSEATPEHCHRRLIAERMAQLAYGMHSTCPGEMTSGLAIWSRLTAKMRGQSETSP